MDLTTFVDTLQTGDLLFFHGQALLSRIIEWACRSPWSHVGLVVRLPGSERVLLWEAVRAPGGLAAVPVPGGTPYSPLDPGERDVRPGVRFVDLVAKLRSELAHAPRLRVGVRHLIRLPQHTPTRAGLCDRLLAAAAPLDGTPYPAHLSVLLLSWIDVCDACGWTWNGNTPGSTWPTEGLFCSELAVVTLAAAGVLHAPHRPGTPVPPADRQTVAAECTVADLCDPDRFDTPLLHGTGSVYAPVEVHTWRR